MGIAISESLGFRDREGYVEGRGPWREGQESHRNQGETKGQRTRSQRNRANTQSIAEGLGEILSESPTLASKMKFSLFDQQMNVNQELAEGLELDLEKLAGLSEYLKTVTSELEGLEKVARIEGVGGREQFEITVLDESRTAQVLDEIAQRFHEVLPGPLAKVAVKNLFGQNLMTFGGAFPGRRLVTLSPSGDGYLVKAEIKSASLFGGALSFHGFLPAEAPEIRRFVELLEAGQ